MPTDRARRAKRIAAITGMVIAGLAVLLVFGAPLVLRGALFARVLHGLLPATQGSVRVSGGSLGFGAVAAGLLGRPVAITLTDVEILDPEGVEVFWAERLTARLVIQRDPLAIVIRDLRPGVARWRFARMHHRPGIGFVAAFLRPGQRTQAERRLQQQGQQGREAPRTPPPEIKPPLPAPRPAAGRFRIENASLDGLSATFDFPGWGLVLNDIRGEGKLSAGGGVPRLSFEVRDVDARGGGLLRILRGPALTPIPFDRVAIARIGTAGERGGDLLLEVSAAATGRSRLGGYARFGGLFAFGQRGVRPGMEIRADWQQAGDALTALALGRGLHDLELTGERARVEVVAASSFRDLDARFVASDLDVQKGPYRLLDLQVELLARGPPYVAALNRVSFRSPAGGQVLATGSLDAARRARLRVRATDLGTTDLLPPPLRPLLGGRAAGWLAARADLRSGSAALEGMDLTLERDRRGPLPGRLRLHSGAAPRPPATPEESLVASVQGARWRDGRLSLDGLRALAFGGRLDARAALDMRRQTVAMALAARRIDLRRAFPRSGLAGQLSFDAEASGPLDDVRARLQFPAGTRVDLYNQPYLLPQGMSAEVRGDQLRLPRFLLTAPGAGQLSVEGQLVFDQRIDLRLGLVGHRLERTPFLSRALPALRGRLAGDLRLHGHPLYLVLDGQIQLGQVALGDVPLGDGQVKLAAHGPGRTRLEGSLFQGISLRGQLVSRGAAAGMDLDVQLDRLRLDRFLPRTPALGPTGLTVGGLLALRMRANAAARLDADFDQIDFSWGCAGPGGTGPGCTHLTNVGPVRLKAVGDGGPIELLPTRLRAPDSEVVVAGRLHRGALDARLEGGLGARLLEPLLRRWPVTVGGQLAAKLTARGPVEAPRLEGTLLVRQPLSVRLAEPPLHARLTSGQLVLEGERLRSDGLDFEAPGVRLQLAGSVPFGTPEDRTRPLAVSLKGEVQGSALVRAIPAEVQEARGTIPVDLKLEGSMAEPRFGGQAQLGPLQLKLRYRDTQVAVRSGRLLAKGRQIVVDRLEADLAPGGRLTLGPVGQPAHVEVVHLVPLTFGQVFLPARGERLQLETPWLSLADGAFQVQLAGDGERGPLRLSGEARLLAGEMRLRSQPRAGGATRLARKVPRPVRSAVLPLALDLRVRANGDRFVIDPGWMPDLHLDLDMQVTGTSARPKLSWQADGRGIYSTIALFLYRLLS